MGLGGHSGSLGDIVSSGPRSPCCRTERRHCTPSGSMDGGRFEEVKGREKRGGTVYVCLSVRERGGREGNGGRGEEVGEGGVVVVSCPMALDLFVSGWEGKGGGGIMKWGRKWD